MEEGFAKQLPLVSASVFLHINKKKYRWGFVVNLARTCNKIAFCYKTTSRTRRFQTQRPVSKTILITAYMEICYCLERRGALLEPCREMHGISKKSCIFNATLSTSRQKFCAGCIMTGDREGNAAVGVIKSSHAGERSRSVAALDRIRV